MGSKAPEIEDKEKEEKIEEYDLIEKETKEPEKTKIERDQKVEGLDFCPFCESENLGKDYKQNTYCCLDCGRTYQVVKS